MAVVDYDATAIPERYDRGRSHGPDILRLWMDTVARYSGDRRLSRILDVGCGTGRFTNALATAFGGRVIGVDPSRKMLAQAQGKPTHGRVFYVRAAGERLPVADQSSDLIFMSMVFHHFAAPPEVARECRRVLRDGALVFLRAATIEQIDAYPYVPFIPAARRLLGERLNGRADITNIFEGAGFSAIAADIVVQTIAATHEEYVEKLEAGGDSVLASLSERELSEGLKALRRHAALIDPRPVVEPIDAFIFLKQR